MITKGDSNDLENNTLKALYVWLVHDKCRTSVSIFSRKARGWMEKGKDETQRGVLVGKETMSKCGKRMSEFCLHAKVTVPWTPFHEH